MSKSKLILDYFTLQSGKGTVCHNHRSGPSASSLPVTGVREEDDTDSDWEV